MSHLSDFEQTMGKDLLDGVRSTVGPHATVDDIVRAAATGQWPGAAPRNR